MVVHKTDGYKVDHRRQYPNGTTQVVSNLTPRKSRKPEIDKVIFFGLQYVILKYLINDFNTNFFQQPVDKVADMYARRINNYLGPNDVGVQHIRDLHALGYLPVEIRALPEGTASPIRVPQMMYWNTHPDFFWVTNYLETLISSIIWGPCNSATIARHYKETLEHAANETGGDINFVPFQGHDFSFRGMFGFEAAQLSGAGHLTSFVGTDTIPAIDWLERNYGADSDKEMVGVSVAATEHSVMCMGSKVGEFETFERLIKEIYPSGIVSIVSDTWDLWQVVSDFLPRLKDYILSRYGKVVIRPDSGDPADILCGTLDKLPVIDADTEDVFLKDAEEVLDEMLRERTPHGEYGGDITEDVIWNGRIYNLTYSPDWNRYDKQYYFIERYGEGYTTINSSRELEPKDKGVIQMLWETFGGDVNEKGYKVLDDHIGAIYGDSITPERAREITSRLAKQGFASTNVVLGIGSYTYQYNTRDTFGYAVKSTYGEVNGEGREIFKDPITDDGTKKSAKGLIKVVRNSDGELEMIDQVTWDDVNADDNELKPVFRNGKLLKEWTLAEIRETVSKQNVTKPEYLNFIPKRQAEDALH